MKLSIGMMVKNEAKHLDECLKSLTPILNEIDSELIIVDTGSDDNTVEIAEKYTSKVYFHKWENDFSEMRNKVLSYCKGEWFFCIDGDEILKNAEELIVFLKSDLSYKYNTLYCSVRNYSDENEEMNCSYMLSYRLFKLDKDFHYEGAVHNQPIYKAPIGKLNITIDHYGYIANDKDLMDTKFKRTTEILKAQLQKEPNNIYYNYQLSVSYSMHKDHDLAFETILKIYDFMKEKKISPKKHMVVYTQLAICAYQCEKYELLEKVAKEGLAVSNIYVDLYFLLAKAQHNLEKFEEAINSYEKHIKLIDDCNNGRFAMDITVTSYTMLRKDEDYINLFMLYLKIDNSKRSLECLVNVKNKKLISQNMSKIISTILESKYSYILKKYYESDVIFRDDDLREKFIIILESSKSSLSNEELYIIHSEFSECIDEYGLLNKFRVMNEENLKNNNLIEYCFNNLNFNYLKDFYSDIFYKMMKAKYNFNAKISNLHEANLDVYYSYLMESKNDLSEVIFNYIFNTDFENNFLDMRINKALERYALVIDGFDDSSYIKLFKRFLEDGVQYIQYLYNSDIIENEFTCDLKNKEDIFMLYMYKANKYKEVNINEYIKYVRKALDENPSMKRGIELLLKDVVNEKENPINTEMENLKKQFKNNIKSLIETRNLQEAEKMIQEYESMVPDDIEIVLLKSEIFMKNLNCKDNKYKM